MNDAPPNVPSNRADRPAFQQRQYEFAAHIRDPERCPRPQDVEERRMAIYRELFFNNVEGFLSNTFPVLRELMDDNAWMAMARDFFSRHQSHTPLFLEIPKEFLRYLEEEREAQDEDLPFLYELAHYEWVELALSVAEESFSDEDIDSAGDLLAGRPHLSSLAWPLSYRFPVHQIRAEFQPQDASTQPTYLLVYRDADDEVHFLELNPVSARLFSLLTEHPESTGQAALELIAEELQHPDPAVVIQGGAAILEQWHDKGIVTGVALTGDLDNTSK